MITTFLNIAFSGFWPFIGCLILFTAAFNGLIGILQVISNFIIKIVK